MKGRRGEMSEEFQYVRTGWSMGVGNTLSVEVRIDSHRAEKVSEEQWIAYGIEVEKHMQAILDFLEDKIWPEQEAER